MDRADLQNVYSQRDMNLGCSLTPTSSHYQLWYPNDFMLVLNKYLSNE